MSRFAIDQPDWPPKSLADFVNDYWFSRIRPGNGGGLLLFDVSGCAPSSHTSHDQAGIA